MRATPCNGSPINPDSFIRRSFYYSLHFWNIGVLGFWCFGVLGFWGFLVENRQFYVKTQKSQFFDDFFDMSKIEIFNLIIQ